MKLSFLTLICLFPLILPAQITIFSEDFQQGIPGNWIMYNADQLTPATMVQEYTDPWIVKTDPENQTDTVVSSTSFFSPAGQASRWLVSPAITLGTYGNILSWQAKSHDPSYPDDYRVWISTTTNDISAFDSSLTVVYSEAYFWDTTEVNLSEQGYDNQTVFIAFELITTDGFKLYLDDIAVRKEDPVHVTELSMNQLSIFPNPFTETISVCSSEQIEKVSISDMEGKTVAEYRNQFSALNVSQLHAGFYIVHVITESGESVLKLMK